MNTKNNPKNQNKFFFLQTTSLLVLLAFLPEFLIWTTLPDDLTFTGTINNIDDVSVYLSAIRQGSEGAWLFTPQFTPEGIPPQLAFVPYLIIGKIQSMIGGTNLLWMYLLRFISIILAAHGLHFLISTIFPDNPRLQKTSYIMLLFSGGIGWILLIVSGAPSMLTPDLIIPEWNTITSALSAPHFLLGIAFQSYFFANFIKLLNQTSAKNALLVSLGGAVLGLSYPFLIAVNGLVLAAFFGVQSYQSRSIPWKTLIITATACLPMIAYIIYYGIILPQDPIWKTSLITNNKIMPPPPHGVIVGYGLLFLFLIIGIYHYQKNTKLTLLTIWFCINFLALYLPFSFSGRFVLGMYIPAILLAAFGLEEVAIPKLISNRSVKPDSTRNIILWLTFPSTLLFILWAFLGAKSSQGYPYYFHQSEIAALEWLGDHTSSDDIILADYPTSNLIPRYGPGLIFAGHLNLTINLDQKLELLHTFWQPETPQSWRDQLIRDWKITYIYQGKFENTLSGGSQIDLPYKIIYNADKITIYSLP